MKRVVFYVRVSRSTDESVSLARQAAELHDLADSEGWTVVGTFSDDGISGRVARAQADAALDAIATGKADVLAVWELSRFSRMGLGAVAKLVTVLRERPGSLFVAKKEGLRSDQPAFGIMASVIAEVAAMEAEATRDRIRSMRSHVLSQTDPDDQRWLGGHPPIGYRTVARSDGPGKMLVVDAYEAAQLREVARRLIAGHALTEVTHYLVEQGVPTAQSPARKARQTGQPTEGLAAGNWRITTLSKVMRSPTLLGRTTREVEVGKRSDGSAIIETRVVSDSAGMPIQRWEPVLDAGTFAALQAVLKVRGPNRVRKAASWLSGQLICGLCGHVMYATSRSDRPSGSFRCVNRNMVGQACPGVSIQRSLTEGYMESVILRMIGDLDEYRVEQEGAGPDSQALDTVAQAITDVQEALVADGADYSKLLPQLDRLKAERQRLLSDPGDVVTIRVPTGRKLRDAWAGGSIREKQFMIADMLDGIRVMPATSNGRTSRVEDRLVPVWMEHPVQLD
ncbi:recombinase family protein [Leifsonia sp. NCR5]|uniref:recombinase family protein n=1 Tax=Leifsonia sp. NCR5 TaxID=1978342 RepID=UPI000A18AC49|nr:recombinase family protein [Leifsonia sp. NCR5]